MNKIVEIFHSIQSEGFHAGRGAIFVRFYGCNLVCDFGNGMVCDEPLHVMPKAVTEMTNSEILAATAKGEFVVITGGEPSLNDINELIKLLQANGKYVAVETNGNNYEHISSADWITYSPKFTFNNQDTKKHYGFSEVKILAGINNPMIDAVWATKHKYIQPIADGNTPDVFNTTYCVDFVKNNPEWRLSIQLHKYLGLE